MTTVHGCPDCAETSNASGCPKHATPPIVARVSEPLHTTPYRCPVCQGRGFVDAGFYSSTTGTWLSSSVGIETCRTCKGDGIVWGQ